MSKLLQNTEAESTKEKEVEIKESVNEEPKEVVEEQFIKKEEPKLKSAPASSIKMPSKTKVLENEQIPEEPTPTKSFDASSPLSLDITAQMSPAAFSWSEEMEKSFNEEEFQINESSDIDRSPASPHRHVQFKKGGSGKSNSNRKGRGVAGKDHHHNHNFNSHKEEKHAPLKKGQRRLTKEKSVEETPEKPQKKVAVKHQEVVDSPDVSLNQTIEIQHPEDESYEKSGSPGSDSLNSEVRFLFLFFSTTFKTISHGP
ncbi:hypothetical protein CRE_02950 [Caenorhabditis remanei]|uniref:Uncharacterized protein n=1 Tax=Caenorhabditis remanei TaxID=31234 RepID=E3LWV6_CAERE|nr:hypothetical protein CRE_02950 [Caenorhabditis remanei]